MTSEPYHWLFRGGDVVAGGLYLAGALSLGALRPRGRMLRAVVVGLAAFGALTVIDPLLAPDCVATVDAACQQRELHAHVSWHDLAHILTSVLAEAAAMVVLLFVERLATRHGTCGERRLARVCLVVVVAAGIGCLACFESAWVGVSNVSAS